MSRLLLPIIIFVTVFWLSFDPLQSHAEESDTIEPVATPVPESQVPQKKSRKIRKGRQAHGNDSKESKEIEGTEAPDRFEADTTTKSQYKYNGESLEVDPD